MKKYIILCIGALFALSCGKNDIKTTSCNFTIGPYSYKTLADAVKAASVGTDTGEPVQIFLKTDISGKGAAVESGSPDIIFNLGTHTYTLEDGATIDVSDNNFTICGEGGSIVASSGTPALQGSEGLIHFKGNAGLKGETAVSTTSEVIVEKDFTGEISGNIVVHNTDFLLNSADCNVHIPLLVASGEDAGFSSIVGEAGAHIAARIDEVKSDQDYPVSADCEGVVSCGEEVHIHNYVMIKTPGTCTVPETYDYVCEDCGMSRNEEIDQGPYGHCNPDGLIYHERVEPNATMFGNVGYWQCPECGRCYSDKKYLKDITNCVLLFPTDYWQIREILDGSGSGEIDSFVLPTAALIYLAVGILISAGTSVADLIVSSDIQWNEASKLLQDIEHQVNAISLQIHQLLIAIKNLTNRVNIMKRQDDIASLKGITMMTDKNIQKAKAAIKDSTALDNEIRKQILDWATFEIGSQKESPTVLTNRLINSFSGEKSFSTIYEEFANSFSIWEHDGYPYRAAALLEEATTICLSYKYAHAFIKDIEKYQSEVTRQFALSSLEGRFEKYVKAIATEMDNIHSRDSLYRILLPQTLNGSVEVYQKNINGPYDFHTFLKNNTHYKFSWNNKDNLTSAYGDAMINNMGINLDKLMPASTVKFLHAVYNSKRSYHKAFEDLLLDDCKFTLPSGITETDYRKSKIIPKKKDGFENKNFRYVSYKIFHFECFRTKNEDTFGVWAVGGWENNPYSYHTFMEGANIVRKNGKISNYGRKTREFYTVTSTEIK